MTLRGVKEHHLAQAVTEDDQDRALKSAWSSPETWPALTQLLSLLLAQGTSPARIG